VVHTRVLNFAAGKFERDAAGDIAYECVLLIDKYPHVRDRVELIKLATVIARNRVFEQLRLREREEEELPVGLIRLENHHK
jgi:hypothetical protein